MPIEKAPPPLRPQWIFTELSKQKQASSESKYNLGQEITKDPLLARGVEPLSLDQISPGSNNRKITFQTEESNKVAKDTITWVE